MTAEHRDSISFAFYSVPGDVDLLYREGVAVPLEPQAVRVLRYLARHNGRVVSKEELLENIWPDVFTTDGVLKRAISQIRRALDDSPAKPRYIATYHGRGYRFLHETERAVSIDVQSAMRRTLPEFDQLAGRESELTLLDAELASALRGSARPVMLLGDAGIGKTQLARRFQNRAAAANARTPYLRFFDYGASQLRPYQAFVDLLAQMKHTSVDEPGADLRNAGSNALGALGDPYRLIVPICQELEALARERPLVLVLDDLQWATEAELDLISFLLRSTGPHPIMLIMTARLEDMANGDELLGGWMRREALRRSFTTLQLNPLSRDTCRSAIESVFGTEVPAGDRGATFASLDIPAERLKAIFDASRGNPFFLMEILRLLVADGVLRIDEAGGQWVWTGDAEMKLPESIVLLAEARLERLDENVRTIVEAASVLGDEFRVVTLARMSGVDEGEVDRILDDGVRQGVLTRRNLSPGDDCRFYHTIIRRIVYDRITERQRTSLHRDAARALESVYVHDRERVAEAVSVHCEASGDMERTFEASLDAWRAASSRWEWRQALASAERASRAAASLERKGAAIPSTRQIDLSLALGEALFSVGRLKEAEDTLTAALQSISGEPESPPLGDLLLLRGRTATALSRYRTAADDLRRAVKVFARAGTSAGELRARIELGGVEAAMGHYDTASEILTASLEQIDPASELAALAYGVFGWATALQGNYSVGAQLLSRAIEASDRSTNLRHRALLMRRLHWVELTRGEYQKAIELALRAREDFRRIGDVAGEAKTNMGLGQARMSQGLYTEAIEYLHETLCNLNEIGDAHCEAETLWLLGRATLESGDPAAAASLLDRSLKMVREIGDRDDEFRILIDIARRHIAEGSAGPAISAARTAEAIAGELGNRDGMGLACSELARGELLSGNVSDAVDRARTAVDLLQHSGLGERWRATAALGECLVAARKPRNAVPQLRRAIDVLESVRNQVPDGERLGLSLAHARIPIQLESALREIGRVAEADEIRRGWNLGDSSPAVN